MQHRVKVYSLNQNGTWDDKGVGHVLLEDNASNRTRNILVVSEAEGNPIPILISQVLLTNNYQKQGDGTIITWSDPVFQNDVAISFQHENGCEYVWKQIEAYKETFQHQNQQQQNNGGNGREDQGDLADTSQAQEQVQAQGPHAQPQQQQQQQPATGAAGGLTRQIDELARDTNNSNNNPHDKVVGFQAAIHAQQQQGQETVTPFRQAVEIPELTIENLPVIAKGLSDLHPCHREGVVAHLRETQFLRKLTEIFHMLEDLEDEESLRHVNCIMKALVMLNDYPTLEALFHDQMILDTIGMLEYDASFPQKQNHREILKSRIAFKEVIPIQRQDVLSKIHQTFKISYIKDTILPIVLDDATFATLSSIILFSNVDILQVLASEPSFFKDLFEKMKGAQRGTEEWKNLVDFLQEICDHTKHLEPHQRHLVFGNLNKLGLFDVTCSILQDGDDALRLKGMDIMMSTLQHDPAWLRVFVMQKERSGGGGESNDKEKEKEEENTLLKTMIDTVTIPSESGLQEQMSDVLRMLLDPDSLQPNLKERSEFWDTFYKKYFWRIANVLTSEDSSQSTLVLVLDLICFCVNVHTMWIKYFALRNKLVDKVAKLVCRKEKVVVLAALRLLRTCIGLKDDFYVQQIIANNAFAPLVQVFLENGQKYNMLNSAVLDLFEFIKKENLQSLIKYSIDKFWDAQLSSVTYVENFKQLKLKHDQNVSSESMRHSREGENKTAVAGLRLDRLRRRRDCSMDKEEEDYFESGNDDDDDDDANNGNAASAILEQQKARGGGDDMLTDNSMNPFSSFRLGGSVSLHHSPSIPPLVLNPLVDYDLDDTDASSSGMNNLYSSNAPAASTKRKLDGS
jgi:protein phosphatase-4 regulatory subunit 3